MGQDLRAYVVHWADLESLEKALAKLPHQAKLAIHILRDSVIDPDTDYFTNSGYIEVRTVDDLSRIRKELGGAQQNYVVGVSKEDNGKPSCIGQVCLEPSTEGLEAFVRAILCGQRI